MKSATGQRVAVEVHVDDDLGAHPAVGMSALRASRRLLKIAPGDLVKVDILTCEHCGGAVKVTGRSVANGHQQTAPENHCKAGFFFRDSVRRYRFLYTERVALSVTAVPVLKALATVKKFYNSTCFHSVFRRQC